MTYTAKDDWNGDRYRGDDEVHFRLYLSRSDNKPTVICVQDFDYLEYDARRILSTDAWREESDAEDALINLLPSFAWAEAKLHFISNDLSELKAKHLARMCRERAR